MNVERISISDFKRDDGFYEPVDLLLTVKSFDLQAIRQRYLKSRNENTGKIGSVERRETSEGGIVRVRIANGKILSSEILARMKEPRGIAVRNNLIGIAAENVVYLISKNEIRKIENPWFSYIHALDFSENEILISSSGFDCIFKYSIESLKQTYEWFAWEHGFDISHDPVLNSDFILTRMPEVAARLIADGKQVRLFDKPLSQVLPTALRSAFINSVAFDKNDLQKILATFFHRGAVMEIDSSSGNAKSVLENLKNPHGGLLLGNEYLATSTAEGEVVTGNLSSQKRFSFTSLPGKSEELKNSEWLQNSILLEKNILTVDSNRTSFVIFNPDLKCYSVIPYDQNWAVQDMAVIEKGLNTENLRQLK